jgi:hypothetical protein
MVMPRSLISLGIPACNRSENLREALSSVRRLRGLETLAATDATVIVIGTFGSGLPIRRIVEKTQAASHARN